MKKSVIVLLICVALIMMQCILPFYIPPSRAAGENWLEGWSYRKSHVINYATGAGTEYQVSIIVDNGTGTDSGGTVYIGNKGRVDLGDVRFTGPDGQTQYSYWIENTTSTQAGFWVKILDSLESAPQTIYVYYGKEDATYPFGNDQTQMDNTFLFADHFYGNTINTSKWGGATSYTTVSNSLLTITGSSGVWRIIWGLTQVPPPAVLRTKTQLEANPSGKGAALAFRHPTTTDLCDIIYFSITTNSIRTYASGAGGATASNPDNAMNIYAIGWTSTSVSFFKNSVAMTGSPRTTNIPTIDLPVRLEAIGDTTSELVSDWVIIRKFTASGSEPTHGAWGEEESLPVGNPPENVSGSITDMDDSNNLYAQRKLYTAVSSASDADGYADITYMEIRLKQNADVRAAFRYTEDTNTFSVQTGSDAWDLDESSSADRTGNTITVTWKFVPQWDAIEESELDIELYAIDSQTLSDTDVVQTNYCDVVTRLVTAGQECYITDDDQSVNIYSYAWSAQTFTVGSTPRTVAGVTLLLYRSGLPSTITASIRATNAGGHPTGIDLTNGTTDGDTLPEGAPYEWREITMDEHLLLPNTKYAIVVRAPYADGEAILLIWRVDGSSPTYTGGNREYSYDSGSTWYEWYEYSHDCMFIVWGSPSADDLRINIGGTVIIGGNVYYGNDPASDIASMFYPPDNEFTSVSVHDSAHDSQATNTTIADGEFLVSFAIPSAIQLNTYHFYINMADADYTDADAPDGDTVVVAGDRIRIDSLALTDERINADGIAVSTLYVTASLEYDDHPLGSGDFIVISGITLTWDAVDSRLEGTTGTSSSVTSMTYNVFTSGNEATYGITEGNINSQTTTLVYDNLQSQSYAVSDSRATINQDVDIDVLVWFDFDDTPCTTATLTINGYEAVHQGDGVYRITRTSPTITLVTYDTVACSVESTYGITSVDQNSQSTSVIWDVVVVFFNVSKTNPFNNEVIFFTTILSYGYDGENLTSYSYDINRNETLFKDDWSENEFIDYNSDTIYIYDFADMTESTYGITAFVDPENLSVTWSGEGEGEGGSMMLLVGFLISIMAFFGLVTMIAIKRR